MFPLNLSDELVVYEQRPSCRKMLAFICFTVTCVYASALPLPPLEPGDFVFRNLLECSTNRLSPQGSHEHVSVEDSSGHVGRRGRALKAACALCTIPDGATYGADLLSAGLDKIILERERVARAGEASTETCMNKAGCRVTFTDRPTHLEQCHAREPSAGRCGRSSTKQHSRDAWHRT